MSVTPKRLAFGIHIRGQRCPTYNAAGRVNQVLIRGLPRRHSLASEVEEIVREALPSSLTVVDLRIARRPQNPDEHRGAAVLTLESYDQARTAMQALRQSSLGLSRYLTLQLGVARNEAAAKMSPYQLMLHQVRERVQATEMENARLRAALAKAGIRADDDEEDSTTTTTTTTNNSNNNDDDEDLGRATTPTFNASSATDMHTPTRVSSLKD